MKKVLSLVLAIVVVASLAAAASAAPGPIHSNVNDFIAHGRVFDTVPNLNEAARNLCTELNNGRLYVGPNAISASPAGEGIVTPAFATAWNVAPGSPATVTGQEAARRLVVDCSENVSINKLVKSDGKTRVNESWTQCSQAITVKEMSAAVAAYNKSEDAVMKIDHLTVFRQRNLVDAAGEAVTINATNWQTGKRNTTVILAYDSSAWSIVGVGKMGEKACETTLPAGTTRYVVAMTW